MDGWTKISHRGGFTLKMLRPSSPRTTDENVELELPIKILELSVKRFRLVRRALSENKLRNFPFLIIIFLIYILIFNLKCSIARQ